MLRTTIRGNGLPRLEDAAEALGSESKALKVYSRAINDAGRSVTPATYRALAKQTGLKVAVTRKALRARKASPDRLTYELSGGGGFIALKYFAAKETRAGVSAAPRGNRRIFAGEFIKGGHFPNRVTLRFKGHVFFRADGDRLPITKHITDVSIPVEMVKGATAEVFKTRGTSLLTEKVHRHLRLVTKGVLS